MIHGLENVLPLHLVLVFLPVQRHDLMLQMDFLCIGKQEKRNRIKTRTFYTSKTQTFMFERLRDDGNGSPEEVI